MLHRFAKVVAGCTVLLVLAGSLVTSTGSGLSVPDWPTSYGWNMFTFPPSKWVGGIFYEHGHRLIASTVGCLTIILAAWLWAKEPRRWLKWLGVSALGAVLAQGLLGGLTVLFFLPAAISTAHAGLAEVFFCLVVSIALFTSPGWTDGYGRRTIRRKTESTDLANEPTVRLKPDATYGADGAAGRQRLDTTSVADRATAVGLNPETSAPERRLRRLATATTALIYAQILVGATMRHTGAGLAIPDFPLMLGHFLPPYWDPGIAIHFSHRVGALLVLFASLATTGLVCSRLRDRLELVRPAALLAALVMVQATLGALTVLSRLNIWLNSVHVVCGALVLTTSLVLTLRSWRGMFAGETVRLTTDPTPVAHAEPVLHPTPTPVLRSMPAEPASPSIHAAQDVGGVRLQPGRGAQA